jgi:hypothetical protein
MRFLYAILGALFALVTMIFALISLLFAWNLLTDGEGQNVHSDLMILLTLAVVFGLTIASATLTYVCCRAWTRRMNSASLTVLED